jgi:hypothetical protein
LVRNQTIRTVEASFPGQRLVDHSYLRAVNLFRGRERVGRQPQVRPQSAVRGIEPPQCLGTISCDIDSRNTADKSVPDK